MNKQKTTYVCNRCGGVFPQWYGKCPACGEWETLGEFREAAAGASLPRLSGRQPVIPVTEVPVAAQPRTPTGLPELDRVLGGGLVAGMLVLLAGDPGLGKSTLLLQAAHCFGAPERLCLYVSGEESLQQVALRSRRLARLSPHLMLLSETEVEAVQAQVQECRPGLLIIDSIQAMATAGADSLPGSVAQVRECSARLLRLAKDLEIPTILVGHVTKDGSIAGPRVLEHMVDTVLSLEGDHHSGYRLLRAVKNRFGSTDELGLFRMADDGLHGVPDASAALLEERRAGLPGSSVTAVMEGNRPLLVEVQALVTEAAAFGAARRSVTGLDYNRTCLILAVLEKRARLPLSKQDVFVNVPGGVRIAEPSTDLALALAIVSSAEDKPLPADLAVLGEVGLTGEVRSVPGLERRLGELARHGFRHCLVPATAGVRPPAGLEITAVEHLQCAIKAAFGV